MQKKNRFNEHSPRFSDIKKYINEGNTPNETGYNIHHFHGIKYTHKNGNVGHKNEGKQQRKKNP